MPSIWENGGDELDNRPSSLERSNHPFLHKFFPSFASKNNSSIEPVNKPPRPRKDDPLLWDSRQSISNADGTSSVFKVHEYPLIFGLSKSHSKYKRHSSVPRKRDLFFTTSSKDSPESPLDRPRPNRGRTKSLRVNSKATTEDDLTCPICLEILYRPRELGCGHAFCLLCLQNYSNSCCTKFSCPSCRQRMDLPRNGVSGLPRNDSLEKIAEHFTKRRTFMTNCAKICFMCQSDEDITECRHCGKGWCVLCKPSHAIEIKQEIDIVRKRLEETNDTLKCREEENKIKLKKLETKISEVIGMQIAELLNKKEKLTTEVKHVREKYLQKSVSHSTEIEDVLTKLYSVSDNGLTWEEAGKQIQRLNQLLESASETQFPRITFDTLSLTLNKSLGSELLPVDSRVLSGFSSTVDDESKSKDDDDYGFILPKEHCNIYRVKSGSNKQKWIHNVCKRPAGVAISPRTGLIYVTGSDACKVYIYDMSGKQLGSFGNRGRDDGQFLCPTGVSFSQIKNELYITDKWKHCIHVFSPEGRFIRQIGQKGKGFGQFSSPESVATDNLGHIYVADTCNDRVQVLDDDGVFLHEVGAVSSESLGHGRLYTKREFSEPVGLAASPDGSRIYVADSGNHRIKVFNGQSGERVLLFGSRGYTKGQFESPESIAVDSEGFIIVGDSGNGRVQIFKPNGHFVGFLGVKSKHKGEFGWVSGVAVTSNRDIVVTDFKNNSLAAY